MSTTLLVIFLVPSLGLLLLGCIFWLTAYRDTATVFNLMAVCTQVVSALALWMSRKDVVTLFGVQKLPSGLLIPILRDTTGVVKISETIFLVCTKCCSRFYTFSSNNRHLYYLIMCYASSPKTSCKSVCIFWNE